MVVGGEKIKQGNCRTKTKIRCLHQQTDESSSTCWFLFLPFVVRCPSLKDSEKVDAHALQYFIDILIHRLSNRKNLMRKTFAEKLTFCSGLLQDVESISDFWFSLISSNVSWRIFSLNKLSFFSPCIIKSPEFSASRGCRKVDRRN